MAHIFAVALCAVVVYLARPGTSLFSWHPTFMILGFGLFMFEAILIFSPHSSLLSSYDRRTKVKWHWILQVLANLSIFLGFASIYYNKDLNGKPHFTTWHGTMGAFAVVITIIQSVCAISLMYYNVRWLNPFGITLSLRKKLHAMSGALSFAGGYFTLILSLYSNFVLKNASDNLWYVLFVLMMFVASVVINQVSAAYIVVKTKPSLKETGNVKKINHAMDAKLMREQKPKSPSRYDRHSSASRGKKSGKMGRRTTSMDAVSKPISRARSSDISCNARPLYSDTSCGALGKEESLRNAAINQPVSISCTSKEECKTLTSEPISEDLAFKKDAQVVIEDATCADIINILLHEEAEETKKVDLVDCKNAVSEPLLANLAAIKQKEETTTNGTNNGTNDKSKCDETKEEETLVYKICEADAKSDLKSTPNKLLPDFSQTSENNDDQQENSGPRFPRRARQRRNVPGAIPWNSVNL